MTPPATIELSGVGGKPRQRRMYPVTSGVLVVDARQHRRWPLPNVGAQRSARPVDREREEASASGTTMSVAVSPLAQEAAGRQSPATLSVQRVAG
jgi:hypothetical protein